MAVTGDAESDLTRRRFLGRAVGLGAAAFLLAGGTGEARARSARPADVQRFVSRPDLVPPVVTVLHPATHTAPGSLFLAPSSGPGQRGTMILDDGGDVVWFHPTSPRTAMNFRAALYRGKPALTWWEGKTEHGLGVGEHVVFDQSYREVARFPAGDHLQSDLHEFLLLPDGTAFVLAYDLPTVDLSSIGHRPRPVVEGVAQQVEVPSARVLFEWRSLDHVGVSESYAGIGPRFDYLHANSIDVDADGHLLLSARNTWAVYKVDRHTGRVIWRLGGKRSDFTLGPGAHFAWQHDARRRPDGLLTVFDNADAPQVEPQSRGLVLRLDTKRMRADLVHAYTHDPPQLAHALGSVQLFPGGNVLVGWGTTPYFTEYASDGTVRFDAKLPHGGENYRTLRFPWVGRPQRGPALATRPGSAGPLLYASWNGATGVAAWQALTGGAPDRLQQQTPVSRTGFETVLQAPPGARYAAVAALDAGGAPLGRSGTIPL